MNAARVRVSRLGYLLQGMLLWTSNWSSSGRGEEGWFRLTVITLKNSESMVSAR